MYIDEVARIISCVFEIDKTKAVQAIDAVLAHEVLSEVEFSADAIVRIIRLIKICKDFPQYLLT
jgi:hypothetical protein